MRKKTGNKLHTWEAALLLAVAAALLWGACTLQRQDALEQKVIRLHVIANSDNEADQALKLRVRDRVLVLTEQGHPAPVGETWRQARQRLTEALPRLQQTAAEEIAAQGSRYTVSAGLEETEFPTREYDGFALPSGEYLALRVVIGEGAGKNWWCAAFPPLCTTAACDFQETAVSGGLGEERPVPHHQEGGRRLCPAVPGGGALGGPAPVAGKALTTEGRFGRDGDSAWSGEAMQL